MKLNPLQVFIYRGIPYQRIIPCKRLFNSTTVHEVITRGDFFAVNLLTGIFTVIPGDWQEKENEQSQQV